MITDDDDNGGIKLDPPYRQAVQDAVGQFRYGDLITHEWLHKHLEVEIPEEGTRQEFEEAQWQLVEGVESFKQMMLEQHLMALQNVRGQGYRLVPPPEQTMVGMSQFRKDLASALGKCRDVLSYVNRDQLTDEQQRQNADAMGKLAGLKAFARKQLR